MRYIQKGAEPETLTRYKKEKNAYYDGDNVFLKSNRKEALTACKMKLAKLQKEGNWSKSVLERMLKEYETPDINGKLIPYSGIVVDYLKRRMKGA